MSPVFPVVSLSPVIESVNPSDKVKLSATVVVKQDAVAVWSIDDPSIDLTSQALTPVTVPLAALQESQFVITLALLPDSLHQRSVYSFTLLVSTVSGGLSSKASVIVSTNGPPLPGSFAVNPSSGLAITQSFLFKATSWVDDADSLPISYSFGFISQQGNLMTVQSRSEATFGSTSLPFASSASQFVSNIGTRNETSSLSNAYIACIALVFDIFGANATAATTVEVSQPKLTQKQLQATISKQLSARYFIYVSCNIVHLSNHSF